MVYDLRMMRAVTPIQTVINPMYLKFLPSVSSRLAVVSDIGQAQILDTVAFAEPRLCLMQMDSPGKILTFCKMRLWLMVFILAGCLTFDISGTSQALAFGDSAGSIHLFSSARQPLLILIRD